MQPLLSIVIANYNFGRFLEDAILSVVAQAGADQVELIVVDGGSTDNSVDVIRKYAKELGWWVSESDHGQSDAFNKGFAHAKGKYLTWLNADDVMPKGAISEIIGQLSKHPECKWFTGNHIRFIETSRKVSQVEWGPNIYPRFLQKRQSPLVVFGPTTFFSRDIYEQAGGIDESFHLAMDTDLWLRFQAMGIKQRRINCFCWAFRMHEDSKTAEFEGHERLDKSVCSPRLAEEHRRAAAKVGYQPSLILRCLMLMGRVLDGSLVVRIYLKHKYMGRIYDIRKGMIV